MDAARPRWTPRLRQQVLVEFADAQSRRDTPELVVSPPPEVIPYADVVRIARHVVRREGPVVA
jgi:hypothetical protein